MPAPCPPAALRDPTVSRPVPSVATEIPEGPRNAGIRTASTYDAAASGSFDARPGARHRYTSPRREPRPSPPSSVPPAPDVRVLVVPDPAGPAAPAGGRDPAAVLRPDDVALLRACTGREPVVLPASALPASATELADLAGLAAPDDPDAPVLLLAPAARLPELPAPTGRTDRASLALEDLAAPDGPDRLAAALLGLQYPPRARVVALVGARGGLGTSTLLAHFGRACAALGADVALLDADPTGGLGLLLGDDVVPGLHWGDLPDGEAAFRPDRLVPVLPTWIGMPVLTGDGRGGAPGPAAVGPALRALSACEDLVLVDLPRGVDPPPGSLVLVVTGLDLRSVVAAQALTARAARVPGTSVALAVRPLGQDLVPDDLEAVVGAPVFLDVPHDRGVVQRIARGDDPTRGRGAVRRAARAVAGELIGGERPW